MDNNAVGEILDGMTVEDTLVEEPEIVEEVLDEEPTEEIIDSPQTYNIDGEDVTLDQIREWRNGNLRQSDYTRKTQQLAEERNRLKDASTLYEYLRNNPSAVNALRNANNNPAIQNSLPSAEKEELNRMRVELQTLKVNSELRDLHAKYGEFNEDELFRTANETNTQNLEIVLQSLLYKNSPSNNAVEIAKQQLRDELENNKGATSTSITQKPSKPAKQINLSSKEKKIAAEFGMSEADYAKWR